MVFLLVGLTKGRQRRLSAPTGPSRPSAGSSSSASIGTLLFILAESRAKEPIVPLDLWRSRTYSASMVSIFFAAFAFFGAIVFLPRWFQVVQGFSPTNSGLALLPLMVGLIGSSIISGLLVSRTGRYKWLIVGSIAIMGVAVLLMTQLTKDTPCRSSGCGCSSPAWASGRRSRSSRSSSRTPCRSSELGVATSNLTFFRQIGGTIALAFVGTIFATSFQDNLVPQMTAAGVPPEVLARVRPGRAAASTSASSPGSVTWARPILAGLPPPAGAGRHPRTSIQGVHGAFSLATAQAFWLGVVGSVLAFVAALAIKEIPLRTHERGPGPGPAAASPPAATAPGDQAASRLRGQHGSAAT